MHFKVGRTTFYMCQLQSWKCLPTPKHSPIPVWWRGTKTELNWIIRTILRKHQTSRINTDNLHCLLLSHIQDNALSETNSSGAHTAVRKAIMAHLYGEKGNATCDSLMSYSNYSDQLIFYINTQHSQAVVAQQIRCEKKIYDDTLCDNVSKRSRE